MTAVKFEKDANGIVTLTLDMPGRSMNVLNAGLTTPFAEALGTSERDTSITGVILTSGKKEFLAGADIEGVFKITDPQQAFALAEQFKALIRRLELCGRPVVATPVGDVPRVVTPEVGCLVPVGDAAALATALVWARGARHAPAGAGGSPGPVSTPTPPDPDLASTARRSDPVTYDVEFDVVFTPPYGTRRARVWLPAPRSDAGQEVSGYATEPPAASLESEPLYGNRLAFFELEQPVGGQIIRQRYRVRVWEMRWAISTTACTTSAGGTSPAR